MKFYQILYVSIPQSKSKYLSSTLFESLFAFIFSFKICILVSISLFICLRLFIVLKWSFTHIYLRILTFSHIFVENFVCTICIINTFAMLIFFSYKKLKIMIIINVYMLHCLKHLISTQFACFCWLFFRLHPDIHSPIFL